MPGTKGKEHAMPITLNPASGSANPAASLPALWAYLLPALDHILRIQTNDPSGKPPAIDVVFYSGIHSACYNYFTSQNDSPGLYYERGSTSSEPLSGADLYGQLDEYFAQTSHELLLKAPLDDVTLVQYLISCYKRYSAGAQSINRLLNYVNRHYVRRAIEEDQGWLRINDVIDSVAKNLKGNESREKLAKMLRERRNEELRKWGYDEGGSSDHLASVEASAEAGSPPDRIIPLDSLALRRFRTELLEPLLAIPKIKGKSKHKKTIPKSTSSKPKGRLARNVKHILESQDICKVEKVRLAAELADCFKSAGIRPDHVLRRRIDCFIARHVDIK